VERLASSPLELVCAWSTLTMISETTWGLTGGLVVVHGVCMVGTGHGVTRYRRPKMDLAKADQVEGGVGAGDMVCWQD
jgi:hypothetical protein